MPEDSFAPIYPGRHVKPTRAFIQEVKNVIKADVEISDSDSSNYLGASA